jgi:hypothetical protein
MIKSIHKSTGTQADQLFEVVAYNPLGQQVMVITEKPMSITGALARARGFNTDDRSSQLTAVVQHVATRSGAHSAEAEHAAIESDGARDIAGDQAVRENDHCWSVVLFEDGTVSSKVDNLTKREG